MKRRIIISLLLLTTSIGLGHLAERSALAHWAILNPVVTNLNDSGAGSLRQAISDANAGGTINFQAGLTGTIRLASELFINKNLTIQGPGASQLTVSGNNAVRVFNIKMGNVALSGLTIANGRRASADLSQGIVYANFPVGGGIFNDFGVVTLTACTISGNSASGVPTSFFDIGGAGGGIYNYGGIVTLTACTISGNSASGGTSAAAGSGGGITNATGIINLTDCTVSNNSAVSGPSGSGANGGGITNGTGTVNLKSSTLSGNTVVANGNNPTFTASAGFGGGIYALQGTVSLTACTLSGNSVTASNDNAAVSTGGGIYTTQATVNLTACTISGNSAAASGGILNTANGGGIASQQGGVTLGNTIVAGNTADDLPDVGTVFTSQGYNLIGNNGGYDNYIPPGNPNANQDIIGTNLSPINPMLGPLANNGGLTKTMALLPGSPAIDKGKSFGLTTDQRGQKRPSDNAAIPSAIGGDNTDIGAFEVFYNSAPIARCQAVTVTAGASCSANASINNGSYDPDSGDSITLTQSPVGPYPLGTTTVMLTVTDSRGASSSCTATVTVVDNAAPTLTLLPDLQLWPADHTYRTLTVSRMVQTVTDACNSALNLNDVKIENVTSDEPDDAKGASDGMTTNDIVIAADCKSVQLRAERDDEGNGRVYVITLRVRDASGNTTRRDFKVSVSLTQSGATAVQDAAAQTKMSGCP